jgi:hypothetical protein
MNNQGKSELVVMGVLNLHYGKYKSQSSSCTRVDTFGYWS